MTPLQTLAATATLLALSNVFMTFAWYFLWNGLGAARSIKRQAEAAAGADAAASA